VLEAELFSCFPDNAEIGDDDFLFFQNLIMRLAGISMSSKKRDLLQSRLTPYIRDNNFKTYSDYRYYLENLNHENDEWQRLINLFTTNKTNFFRERSHFEYIEKSLIPFWKETKLKDVKIWSAACSGGEEPYSLAMFLEKKLPHNISYQVFASDIDTDILNKAMNGVYSKVKQPEIPTEYQKDSIALGKGEVGQWFRIQPHLKDKIVFFSHNLIKENLPSNEVFDLILCRNVMIYFSKPVIEKVARKLYEHCTAKGSLFIGHSESLQGTQTKWFMDTPSVYKKTSSKKK
jgi:chemotaxis methyl-accepting protein methylase